MKSFRSIATRGIIFVINCLVFSSAIASVNPEDPVVLDEIVVSAARWISGGGGTGPGGGGTYGKEISDAVIEARVAEKQRICTALKNSMQRNQCGTKQPSAPRDQGTLNIDGQRFPTSLFWGPTIFNAATNMFNNGVQDFGAFTGATAGAAVDACRGVAICIREVFVYFGINYVALPDGGISGNVNDVINEYMRAYLGPGRAPNPYFDTILNKYANGLACVAAAQAAATMKC